MICQIAIALAVAALLWAFCRLEACVEKAIRARPPNTAVVYVKWSLGLFKYARAVLFAAGALEATFAGRQSVPMLAAGCCLVVFGIAMRVAAIRALGSMWSFHATQYADHRIVRDSVYRVFRHPAYLGNLYLTGLLLVVGAPVTGAVSVLFVIAFYALRKHYEERILAEVETNR